MYDPEESLPAANLRTMQILAGALVMGLVTFFGIALFIVLVQRQGQGIVQPGQQPLLSYIAVGLLVLLAPLSFFVPNLVTRNGVQRIARSKRQPTPGIAVPASDRGELLMVLQTSQIIGMALLEGVSFFGCITYLLEGQILALVVVLAGLVLMLARFPSEGRVRKWLCEQMDQLAQMR